MKMLKFLALVLTGALALAAAALTSGCTSVYTSNKITHVSTRGIGLRFTTTATTTETPEVDFGFFSTTVTIIPTSTNGISTPRFMGAFNAQQKNPFSSDITENIGAGDVYIGGTNDTSKAIIPSAYIPPVK
jgi:hypothetical protein